MSDGVSQSVSSPELLITVVLFLAVYAFLLIAWARVIGRFIQEGPVTDAALAQAKADATKEGE